MKQKQVLIFSLLVLLLTNCNNNSDKKSKTPVAENSKSMKAKDSLVFKLEKVADSLYASLALANAHDGSCRIFIGEQAGKIFFLKMVKY
ncbi:MAG: hypothetical protein ABI472_18080 [Ginsengibacter sp.]